MDGLDALQITNQSGKRKAFNEANAALDPESVNARTQALMNPNAQNQIEAASDAVMGQFGGTGNLYGSAAQKALADRAQSIASNEWNTAADRALQTIEGQGANKIAQAQADSFLGEVGGILGGIFG